MSLAPTSFIGCLRHGWDLTPWDCIEMQLHELRPWIGWPCNGCERPVTIEVATSVSNHLKPLSPEAIRRGRAAVKKLVQNLGFCPDSPPLPVSASPPPPLPVSDSQKPRRTWPQGMSKAVALRLRLV